MIITKNHKDRLKELAGIISEATTDAERKDAFAGSDKRVPFNRDLMAQAIKEGREVGILFQSKNDKYKMPVAKYRIILPMVMGTSKKGNLVIRAFHKMGQSESKARATGVRSAEAQGTWRLFKAENIKGMWMTGNFFRTPPQLYNKNDKGMTNILIAADFDKIRKFQDNYFAQKGKDNLKNKKKTVDTFNQTGERPLEQPIANPEPISTNPPINPEET